jgi:DNA-binding response OmpR family regulator
MQGSGSITDLATGETHQIKPGVMYALDKHDKHTLRADEELANTPVMMLTALVEENPDSLDGETLTGGLPFVSKTSGFDTILACIEKHLGENANPQASS